VTGIQVLKTHGRTSLTIW